jgi:hypothetical protein
MREFAAEEWFTITGLGKVCTFKCTENIPRDEVYNQKIKVDGIIYVCTGIERFARYLSDPILHKGESIGLLVEKET